MDLMCCIGAVAKGKSRRMKRPAEACVPKC